jgi:hypothetical protein
MNIKTLSPELLHKMDAYRRAANYLSVGQIYLYDNPLLKRPLQLAGVVAGRPQPGRGAETADPYGPNEIKENQSVCEMPHLFLGSHPVDDRSSRDPFDGSPALAGFLHHPHLHQEDTSDSFIDGHILPLAPKLGAEILGVTDCAD